MMTEWLNELINDQGVCRAAPGFAWVCLLFLLKAWMGIPILNFLLLLFRKFFPKLRNTEEHTEEHIIISNPKIWELDLSFLF